MAAEVVPLLILGGTGRLGRMLRTLWPWALRGGVRPIWQARAARPGCLEWDILHAPPPPWAGGIVLCLAGGRSDLGANTTLALAALAAARAQGARHVFLASSAAVYRPGADLAEHAVIEPPSPYGAAKRAMEVAARDWHAAQGGPGLTILRIGNVIGADALIGAGRAGPVTLDPVPDAPGGPVRSCIGPVSFAAVLARLAARAAAGEPLPAILNIAAPRPVAMAALLDAAALPWAFGPPDLQTIPVVGLNTAHLQALVRLPPQASQPQAMIAEWRMTGARS